MRIAVAILFILLSFTLSGQGIPDWLDEDFRRMKFPANVYLTGFVYRVVEKGITAETEQAKLDAQAELVKQVRLMLRSKTQSQSIAQSIDGKYSERESFESRASTEANAEIIGMKTETYFDQKSKLVYAFAYANRYELIGYYKANLSVNLGQIESFVKTAQDLEANREKAKARQQLEMAKPLFSKVRYAQDLLTALDGNATPNDLQQPKTEQLYNTATQLLAKLAQGVYIFVESNENLFGQKVDIVANKVKAELAVNGCSFTDNERADFILRITVTTRSSDMLDGLVFCYADAAIELYDVHKQKTVYSDEIAQKGGSNSKDKAGRRAMNDVATKIAERLKKWVQ